MRAAITIRTIAAQTNRRAISAWTLEKIRKIIFIGRSWDNLRVDARALSDRTAGGSADTDV
jgi:hypothetical protein